MLHDDYLCLVESGKQQIKEVRRKFNRTTWKQRQLLSESGFVLRIAPPPLSRDGRIIIKKSEIRLCFSHNYLWVNFPKTTKYGPNFCFSAVTFFVLKIKKIFFLAQIGTWCFRKFCAIYSMTRGYQDM